MIFFVKHGGQLCNRLWALYPAYAFARARRKRLHVLFADPGYLALFPNAGESKGIKFWFTRKFWHKVRFMNWIENILDAREIHGELRDYSDRGGKYLLFNRLTGGSIIATSLIATIPPSGSLLYEPLLLTLKCRNTFRV